MRILFTKSLSNTQKAQIESFGVFDIVEDVPFINTSLITYQQFVDKYGEPVENHIPCVVSSVRASEWLNENLPFTLSELWAISEKTAEPLQEKVNKVYISTEASSAILAKEILSQKYEEINFFCGNLHRPEIPQVLGEQRIKVNLFEVYTTTLTPVKLSGVFDIICFLSPSAVDSYFELNSWGEKCTALCIGQTTAEAVKNRGVEKIIYPELSGFENMLDRLKRHLELENGISRIEK